jgi:16S rRNA (cytosine967-C5)-methyltransferase
MSVQFSHPEWFIMYFLKEFSEEFVKELMIKNNTPPEMTIRVNTLKCNRDHLEQLLLEKNIHARVGIVDDALIVSGLSGIEKSEEFLNGLFQVQDQSSMLSSLILNPSPLDTVYDLCSAPGGKATHMAQIMKNRGEIVSYDIHSHKLKLVSENAKRLGIDIINEKLKDSAVYDESLAESADKVLVDAPCSGLGLIRKKPEIKWNIKPLDFKSLASIQRSILLNASKYVKHGGNIVYSTCTITKEENEEIVDWFIKGNKDFEMVNITSHVPQKFISDTCNMGYIKLFPNIQDTDGFFIAKFRRK